MYTQEQPLAPTKAKQTGQNSLDATNTPTSPLSSPTESTNRQSRLLAWWKATLVALPVFLMTRFIFLLLTYFGGVLFFVPNYSPEHLSFHNILYNWYRWDVVRFATIATNGYVSLEYAAFFPLYPALERALSVLFGGNILVTGMVISNLALLGMLIVLYRLVEKEFDSDTARRTILYISIFPTALFFFAAYNESLFLFFMLLCFYALRCRSWWLAGLCGGLATLTRSIGVFLVIIFLYEFTRQIFPRLQQALRDRQLRQVLPLLSGLPAVLLIPLGLGIFAYVLDMRLHDPLAFVHAQLHWHESLSAPWKAPLTAIKSIIQLSPFTFAVPHDIIDLTAFVLFLILLLLCFVGPERFARDQWTFALFGLLALISSVLFPGIPGTGNIPYDPLPSMQRYVLEIFACFILLARFGRRSWFHQTYLLIALPLLTLLTLQFLTGHWTI
jgi:Gpi18-like mannosyltransferase